MAIKLDHVFILTEADAPQADLLTSIGLVEGARSRHPGQGTSNRRFFFDGMMLEFLYVHDVIEAVSGSAKGLCFQDRCTQAGASPFGLIMTSVEGASQIPFEGWKYCPDYFADDQCFHVGSNSNDLDEPLCICMPDNLPLRKNVPVPENLEWTFSSMRINVPVAGPSSPLRQISTCENVEVVFNKLHCLELTFNDGAQNKQKDFRPEIPLVFNW